MKEKVYMKKGTEYNPFAEDARPDGTVVRWYAVNKYGNAVTWARTRAAAAEDARRMGYSIGR